MSKEDFSHKDTSRYISFFGVVLLEIMLVVVGNAAEEGENQTLTILVQAVAANPPSAQLRKGLQRPRKRVIGDFHGRAEITKV